MFYLKKLAAFALPPFGLVVLGFLGLWLARRHPRTGRSIIAIALLALGALSLPPVADTLVRSLEVYPPISKNQLARAQAIVVLGGGKYFDAPEYDGDTVNRWTLERIRYGARLQADSGLPILVSGGAAYGGRPEAQAMTEVIEREFHGQVKWEETSSRDTAENAAFSAAVLKKAGIKRVALVTHGWHLRRAVPLFQRQGIEALPAPTGFTTSPESIFAQVLPSGSALEESSVALREWLGILAQQWLH